MVQFVWLKVVHNALVFGLSLAALLTTINFVTQVEKVVLPEAPKCTNDLQKVFLPPLYRMQIFVFIFDCLIMLYYFYQMPVWDCIKEKFPFFQYESKSAEKADCTTLLLNVMFNLISKGLALAIVLISSNLANDSITQIAADYSYDTRNKAAISALTKAQKPLDSSMILNWALCGLLAFDFLTNTCCIGKNLRSNLFKKVISDD